jgi:hypothetical protein
MTKTKHLDAWLAQEQTIRAALDAGAGPGVAQPGQLAGKNGLEVMQAMLRGELPYPTIAQTLDFMLIEVAPGHAVFQGRPGRHALRPCHHHLPRV